MIFVHPIDTCNVVRKYISSKASRWRRANGSLPSYNGVQSRHHADEHHDLYNEDDKHHDHQISVNHAIQQTGYEYNEGNYPNYPETEKQIYLKLSTIDDITKMILGNMDQYAITPLVTNIAVCSSPLEALYSKSPSIIKEKVQKQYTSIDYHVFLVIKTNIGIFLTLEKWDDGIYIGKGPLTNVSICELSKRPRISPVKLLIEDESKYTLLELIALLENEFKDDYNLFTKNCKHFAKRLYDKIAHMKYFDYTYNSSGNY